MAGFTSLFSVSRPAVEPSVDLTSAPKTGSERIEQAFSNASQATGLPFDYFMTTAMRESSLDVNAAATTSTARGPFQFIEQTWLSMVHQHGADLGLREQADLIQRQANGRYSVPDPVAREDVLNLRYDPNVSAMMSGRLLQDNARALESELGRQVSFGEGYLAHVMGATGAVRLISLVGSSPQTPAANVFPTQAEANRGLFYARNGSAVSVQDLYDRLTSGFPQGFVNTSLTQTATSDPMRLEPAGFKDLPTVAQVDIAPDPLSLRGLFVPGEAEELPLFASLYAPLQPGLGAPASQQIPARTTVPNPTVPPAGTPSAHSSRAETDLPLDLNRFAATGQLDKAYGGGADARVGSDLVPPV